MDYSATLNLPKTDFPMKANLAQREPEIQKRWEAMDLYRRMLERPAPKGTFILHDGPPYSNGDIHLGHALNKILKDLIVKSRCMEGYHTPYVPGWDNHGLPIEKQVADNFRKAGKSPDRLELRQACREYAAKWIGVQREQFKRLGVHGDWENPYLTMSHEYEAAIVRAFADLANAGFIYRGLKPVHWCATDQTALADAEIEYGQKNSPAIYVRFPLREDSRDVLPAGATVYTVIWTTTPWTIPANLAVAFHPEFDYVLVEAGGASYLLAERLLAPTAAAVGWESPRVLMTVKGAELEDLVFGHPLFDRTSRAVLADYVTLEQGTGAVHTAPGHGKEDFATGQKYGLPVLSPVDNRGRFTDEAGPFAGLTLKEGDQAVIAALREAGHLLAAGEITHDYPHCWRCHNPVSFRATTQWFMNIDHEGFRDRALAAIRGVEWFPKESINRITAMVGGRPDWCLSRQRAWGVGIPAFYCDGCSEAILTPESLDAVVRLVEREGSDAWYACVASEILRDGFACPQCGGTSFTKETDILDVWFDSGSSCRAVLETRPELRYPADVYLEGPDQHRGWFNSSLMVGLGTRGAAPYRQVVTNGWTLDEEGRTMSKSKGTGVSPHKVAQQHGIEILRLWTASTNYFEDVRLGENILKQTADNYRKIRNTLRFMLGNLSDFRPDEDALPEEQLQEIDRWALHRTAELIEECRRAYDLYEFHRVTHAVLSFCIVDMSALYLDVLKDRLYASAATSWERRSAQTALWHIVEALVRLLTPILSHTCEEAWSYLPPHEGREDSPQLALFPVARPEWRRRDLAAAWERLLILRDDVNRALEEARQAGRVEKAQAARVTLTAGPDVVRGLLADRRDWLAALFLVPDVLLREVAGAEGVTVTVEPAAGERCERCWLTYASVGQDAAHPTLCARCSGVVAELAPS